MDFDVGIDEHEHVSRSSTRSLVPGGGRTRSIGIPNDEQLLGTALGDPNRVGADRERGRVVGGRDDGCERDHNPDLSAGANEIS